MKGVIYSYANDIRKGVDGEGESGGNNMRLEKGRKDGKRRSEVRREGRGMNWEFIEGGGACVETIERRDRSRYEKKEQMCTIEQEVGV